MLDLSTVLPAATPTIADMRGAEIIFKHENSFLYPGRYVGVVQSYEENRKGEGFLWVKSPSFNIPIRIHESYMKGYAHTVSANAKTAAA